MSPDGSGGIMVGTKTSYVQGKYMKEAGIGRYRDVVRTELEKRVEEAFNDLSLHHVIDSLAGMLTGAYPDYPVYDSPNQQGTSFPCFFLFFIPSTIEEHVGNHYFRDLGVDLVFVQQRNLVNGNRKIHEIAEFLDRNLDPFPYTDGSGESVPVPVQDQQWSIEDEELHYQSISGRRILVEETGKPDARENGGGTMIGNQRKND